MLNDYNTIILVGAKLKKKSKVLLLTNKNDITADYIVLELQKRNVEYFRFNTEDYHQKVSCSFFLSDKKPFILFETPKGKFNLNDFKSILYRRPGKPLISEDINDNGIYEFCFKEAEEFLEGIWANFNGLWVSFPPYIFQAQNKILQLGLAKKIGFNIPSTLVSNNPKEISKFIDDLNNKVVVKAVRQGVLTIDDSEYVIFTSRINSNDINGIDDAKYSPSIYQELIDKKFDLRINVIGKKVFAVEIQTSTINSKRYIDWRAAEQENLSYQIHKLPNSIEDKCKAIVTRLKLNYGAIDMVYSNNDMYYFLEINPNGQWAWLEQITDLNLTKTFVDLLTDNNK